jgi:hypothetical protein
LKENNVEDLPQVSAEGPSHFRRSPAFTDEVHIGHPNIGNRDRLLQRITDMLDLNWRTNNSPYVQIAFEVIEDHVMGNWYGRPPGAVRPTLVWKSEALEGGDFVVARAKNRKT